MKLTDLKKDKLQFFIDPLKQGFNVMSNQGDVHDHYDTREEAEKVRDGLNARSDKNDN